MFRRIAFLTVLAGTVGCSQGYEFALPAGQDEFSQAVYYNRKVDVIFVMDNSSGMEEHNLKLRNTIPGLVATLLGQGLDMHIAVISSSMGGANPNGGAFLGSPKYLTSATGDLSSQLVSRLSSVGSNGSDLERGLDSLVTVLSPGYQTNTVPGFLRSDSLVAVISVSSEDDKSSTVSGGVAGFMARLDDEVGKFEGGGRRWTMNFIGVLSLGGSCVSNPSDPSGYKEPGLRWMEMADASGGIKESVCGSDLSSAAMNLRRQIVDLVEVWRLNAKPVEATIVVTVDGVVVPRSNVDGWDYDPIHNTVKFYGTAIPQPGQVVAINYDRAEAN